MKVKSDNKELELTEDYIQSIKHLMKACILMMRKVEPEYADCWYYGVCRIKDFMDSNGHIFVYGGKDDIPTTFKTDSEIWIEVPFI